MVYSTVDGKNDLEEETRELADIRNPNLGYITFVGIFIQEGWSFTPPCWRPLSPSPPWWCHKPLCCHTYWNCQTLKCAHYHYNLSLARAHWKSNRTLNKTPTPTVSSIKLSLPSTVSSTLNTHDLKVVPHVWNTKKSYLNHPHHSISHPSWRTFQLKWYIIMSATSLVIFSLLSLQSTVPSTTKPPEHRLGNWGIRKMDFQRTFKCFSLVLSGLVGVEKNQICENRRWLPSAISELAVRLSLRDP